MTTENDDFWKRERVRDNEDSIQPISAWVHTLKPNERKAISAYLVEHNNAFVTAMQDVEAAARAIALEHLFDEEVHPLMRQALKPHQFTNAMEFFDLPQHDREVLEIFFERLQDFALAILFWHEVWPPVFDLLTARLAQAAIGKGDKRAHKLKRRWGQKWRTLEALRKSLAA